jgi:hypothetical protein
MATDHGSPRETEGPEPGVAYGLLPRQLPTQLPPNHNSTARSAYGGPTRTHTVQLVSIASSRARRMRFD